MRPRGAHARCGPLRPTWLAAALASFAAPTITAGSDVTALNAPRASRIERRVANIGLRVVDLPVRAARPTRPRLPNLCLNRSRAGFPKPSCNSNEPGYGDCVWAAVDGVPWEGEYEWSSDYRNPDVPLYEVDFGKAARLGSVRVWLRRGYEMRDFDVEVRAQGSWRTVARIRGNRDALRTIRLTPVDADALRVACLSGPAIQPTIRRITELEAFAPEPPPPTKPASFVYRVALPAGQDRWLEVREAYGEGETLREVDYEVRLNGRAVHRRTHRCDGPGPISYAVALPPGNAGRADVAFVDTSGRGLAVARVRVLVDPVGVTQRRGLLQPMLIAPRIEIRPPYTDPGPDRVLGAWVEALKPAGRFFRAGLLAIVGYAAPNEQDVAAHIRAYAALAKRHGVPWVLQLSSWWADTPLRVPDGLGGTFGDIRYQQIAYSRHDTYDDPGLKEFMEKEMPGSYSVHYGLTVPNLWSSTPWLTMNEPRLNAFKRERLASAIRALNAIGADDGASLLQAIVTDDEPIYWNRITDWMEQGYAKVNGGVRRTDLMLDFNPAVLRDAARDGLRLDPSDGLSRAERDWLHRNNARYVAMVCRAIRDALPSASPLRERIFNYILAQPVYPLDDYGHPGWELGMVPGAAIGLEAFDERYFTRARDLGPLANSDLECGNPSAEQTVGWEANFRAWHDAGCGFVQLCNPGPAENWRGLSERVSAWDAAVRDRERALSMLVQDAAIAEWRRAVYR